MHLNAPSHVEEAEQLVPDRLLQALQIVKEQQLLPIQYLDIRIPLGCVADREDIPQQHICKPTQDLISKFYSNDFYAQCL